MVIRSGIGTSGFARWVKSNKWGRSRLPQHPTWVLIIAEPDELCVPQVISACPLQKLPGILRKRTELRNTKPLQPRGRDKHHRKIGYGHARPKSGKTKTTRGGLSPP